MLGEITVLILRTAFNIVLIATVARFLAQMARADFYNPLAQTVIKITDPFIKPLRRLIPSVAGLDAASLIAIWLGQLLLACLIILISGFNPIEILPNIIIWSLISVAGIILMVLQWGMFISAIGGMLTMGQHNPFLAFLQQMVDPFVGPFRKLNLQVGMLDLSYLVAFFVIIILRQFILAQAVLPATGYWGFVSSNLRGLSPLIGI